MYIFFKDTLRYLKKTTTKCLCPLFYKSVIRNLAADTNDTKRSNGALYRTSIKSCLFYKKICQQVGFSSATDLSDNVKNERNVPNVQRCRHLKLPSSGPRQNVTKNQKSYLAVTHDANSI